METRQDVLIGLFILAALGIVVGALIATSGWLERRYNVYMRTASADGLTVDTKVLVQGLEIGRVTRVVPHVDRASGGIAFVARLSLAERFADGARLQLPAGTRAEITQVTTISTASVVRLLPPASPTPGGRMLVAGDTIDSQRRGSALDEVTAVAGQLSNRMTDVLNETRHTLERVEETVTAAQHTLRTVTPAAETTLVAMARTVARVDSVVARLDGAGFPDSLTATLARTDRLLLRLDSIAGHVETLTTESQSDLRESTTNLVLVSRQLNHFIEQMTRRPYRLLTGVKPLATTLDTSGTTHPAPQP